MWTCSSNEKLQRVTPSFLPSLSYSPTQLFHKPVIYGPFLPQPYLMKHKKDKQETWAEHCSKWQANALVISKKTLTAKTYIFPVLKLFTNHSRGHNLLCFHVWFFFIITCHMRSLDYKSTWTNCLYISMHSCLVFTSYLQTWTKKRGVYNTCSFMCFIYISRMENKKQPYTDLQSTQDMHIK